MSSREEKPLGLNIGSASIIMVFTVLCLTIFSVLAFISAASEYKTAQHFAESTSEYYEADEKATSIRNGIAAELADGSIPQTVAAKYGVIYTQTSDIAGTAEIDYPYYGIFAYCVKISNDRHISIELAYDGSVLHTVKWQEENISDWEPNIKMEITDPDKVE